MTTRKALIERIQSMQLGTQEMLDAAKDDATLIPFDTLFIDESGNICWRVKPIIDLVGHESVAFVSFTDGFHFFGSEMLRTITEE